MNSLQITNVRAPGIRSAAGRRHANRSLPFLDGLSCIMQTSAQLLALVMIQVHYFSVIK